MSSTRFVVSWLCLLPIVLLAVWFAARSQRFPGVAPPTERGVQLRAWSPGGRAAMNYTRGMLALTVYERGLLIAPGLGTATWIDRGAIRAIEPGTGVLEKGSRVQSADGDFLLWNTADEHAWLVAWWRGTTV